MNTNCPLNRDGRTAFVIFRQPRWLTALLCALALFVLTGSTLYAQTGRAEARQKLPAPDKIIGDYWKAVGGKKRLAGVKVATYEWTIDGEPSGSARTRERFPAAARTDLTLGGAELSSAASPRSAWMRGAEGNLRTLTDAEAGAAKLQAALAASRLIDYKKLNVLARVVALDRSDTEAAYVLEFSTRAGARLGYSFGVQSKLLLKIEDEARQTVTRLGDYRAESGLLVPHRLRIERAAPLSAKDGWPSSLTLSLQRVSYDANFSDALFDPPSSEALDIPALLKEVEKNQEKLDERVAEYAFTEKRTERKINDKGEIKEEKVTVYEIYPLPGGGSFYKLISENGVPLSAERAAKQDKEIAESVAKYERERERREQKKKEAAEKNKGEEKKKDDDDDISVAQFLNACEFVSPRRERLREREAVVFDFRPRPGFRPRSRAEDIITKLIGIVWIDPLDKQVIRLEAKLAEGYKMGGGLVASIRPGSSFVFEQTRIGDGVWLPRFAQVNFSAKIFLFKGIEANETREFSDYRHFETETKDYKLDAPAKDAPAPPKP
jgi:hypothetical protein